MTEKTYKDLPYGEEGFVEVVSNNRYYVDKTSFIKTIVEDSSSVLLITRPRRFGKTLFMSTLSSFLRIANDGTPNTEYKLKLFESLDILKDKNFVEKHMGQYPVISISLKNVFGNSYKEAYDNLARVIVNIANQFLFLNESHNLTINQKNNLKKLQNKEFLCYVNNIGYLTESLEVLSDCLYQHFGKQVIILIDEYDVPLSKAAQNGYHKEMVTLISSFYSIMKKSPSNTDLGISPIKKVVLTGCLKVAKNTIFTGVNNFRVNTILSKDESLLSIIGFTKDETLKFLKDYDMEEYSELVKDNYDGYRFFDKEMFTPWDIVCFIKENYHLKLNNKAHEIVAGNYWANSTSSNALLSYVGYLSEQENQKLQDLMDGKSVETTINDSMNYDDLKMHRSEDFFSLLLHTGYLTVQSYRIDNSKDIDEIIYSLKIPNREIKKCFSLNINQHFNTEVTRGENKALKLANALLDEDIETAINIFKYLLRNYVSSRDSYTKARPENFYHGFISGILTNSSNAIANYQSNQEVGDGYADIIFQNLNEDKVIIIEIKVANSNKELINSTDLAIKQIIDKQYGNEYLDDPTVKSIICYGISFCKKQCWITKKKLK